MAEIEDASHLPDHTLRNSAQSTISSDQYFELLESISEPFYGLDADWRFIYLNHKAGLILGKPREELLGKQIWEEFPKGIHTQSYHEMHRARREQKTARFETFSALLERWIEVEVYPTRTGLSVYFRDIQERKEAQSELEYSQQQLRLITDALPVLISYIGADLRYKFVNKQYEERFGIGRNQIIGKSVSDLLASVSNETAREEAKRDLETALSGKAVHHEREVSSSDGRSGFVRTLMLPHMLDDGTLGGVITMVEDVTSRKQDEASLARLAAIVMSSKDAIFSTTLEGIVTSWNQGAEKIFGYSADEMLQKSFTILVPPEKLSDEAARLQSIANGQTIENYDAIRLRKDGSTVFVSVSLSPIKDGRGQIIGASRIAQDVTKRKQAEEAVRESEARLTGIIDSAMDAIITINEDQRIIMFNHAAEMMFGCKGEDAVGSSLERFIPGRYRMAHQAHIKEFGQTGITTRRMETLTGISGLRSDGQEFPIDASISQLESLGAKYFTVILRDITARRHAEEGLARLASIVTSSNDAIVSKTLQGIITSWNQGAEKIFGYSAAEILHKSITILIPPDRLGEEDIFLRKIAAGESVQNYDTIRLRKDGSRVFISVSLSPIKDERGNIIGVSKIAQDVSDRKREEIILRQSEAALKQAQRLAHVGSWAWHIPSNHLEWSDEMYRIFGLDKDRFGGDLNEVISQAIHPDDREAVERANIAVVEAKSPQPLEYRVLWPDGTVRVVWAESGEITLDTEGNLVSLTGIVQDITERKQAEAEIRNLNEHLEQLVEARTLQLQIANQELDAFAYVVSHDLKTPLRNITQLASWLREDYASSIDAEALKMIKFMEERSIRMHDMIEDILHYSRIGRVIDNLTKVDLNTLVAGVIDLLAPPDAVDITVARDLPTVYGDEIRLHQVFQNLIGNAIKFLKKPNGKVSVTFVDQDADWQFAIADNGPGIAPQYHEKIFQIFQTLQTHDNVEGTGIGLSLVKKIVELHQGRIWLESTVGEGTTFYFTLPKSSERNLS